MMFFGCFTGFFKKGSKNGSFLEILEIFGSRSEQHAQKTGILWGKSEFFEKGVF